MKKALLVGINYVGTSYELRGCINDVLNIKALLTTQYGFDAHNITTIFESEATTDRIKVELKKLTAGAKPGDVLVFHYSGHGSQLPSSIEEDKWEEIICPIDLNWRDKVITDNDFKAIFSTVPNGVNTTIILDCCHSGDALDQAESFSPLSRLAAIRDMMYDAISSITEDSETRSRYLPPPKGVQEQLQRGAMTIYQYSTSRDVNSGAILIATCAPHQTSADAYINGVHQGAGTFSLISYLTEHIDSNYYDLITAMNNFMLERNYTQRPQLDGSYRLHPEKVFEPWSFSAMPSFVEPSTPTNGNVVVDLPVEKPKKKKEINLEVIIAAIAIIIFILFVATR